MLVMEPDDGFCTWRERITMDSVKADIIEMLRECAAQEHGMARLRDSLGIGLESGWQQRCLSKVADMVDAELERTYMRLPVDVDGVPIRPGDEIKFGTNAPVHVYSIGTNRCDCGDFGWFGSDGGFYGRGTLRACRHVQPNTVESLLQELADEVWEASCACQTTWSDSGLDGIAERYAERIREVVEHEKD